MGPFCLVTFFVLTLSAQQGFAEDEPVFPTYSGDIRVGGYLIVQDLPEIRVTFWWSESNKAVRQDFKSLMGSRKRIQFERQGKYGREVLISKESGGNRECTYRDGTDESPFTYKPFFGEQNNKTFVGTKTEGKLVTHKWLIETNGYKQVVYMREDENELVPYRIESEDITVLIINLSKQYIPPYLFAYNEDSCKEDVNTKYLSMKHLL